MSPREFSTKIEELRSEALDIFRAGVDEADPARAVARTLGGSGLAAPPGAGRVRVVSFGKGACSMGRELGRALEEAGADWSGLAVVNRENFSEVDGFRVLVGGHPLPDEAGARAAGEVADFVSEAGAEDLTFVLVSGGGSAILPAPAEGITLADKLDCTARLLACGADIGELNTIRKHLSFLKGGGLAQRLGGGEMSTLILSDVIGDDLSTIASGPTVPDPTTFADAVALLRGYELFDELPAAVRERLAAGCRGEISETLKPGAPVFERVSNRLVGSNGMSLAAAADRARELGYSVSIFSEALTGEARRAGADLAAGLAHAVRQEGAGAILAGGETTVTLRGAGRGGRNQELALSFALESADGPPGRAWSFLSAGTDGIDGPTDAAGGLVDPLTLDRGIRQGSSPGEALENNDSYAFLDAAGGLLKTGATGTNVADLQILLLAP